MFKISKIGRMVSWTPMYSSASTNTSQHTAILFHLLKQTPYSHHTWQRLKKIPSKPFSHTDTIIYKYFFSGRGLNQQTHRDQGQRGSGCESSSVPGPLLLPAYHTSHSRARCSPTTIPSSQGRAQPLTRGSAAAEWRGGGDGRGHGRSKASTAVAWRSGHIPSRHWAGQGQRELRLNLLL